MTICEINGKPVFEIRREAAAALNTQAELYTCDGSFVKCANQSLSGYILDSTHNKLQIGGVTMKGCTISKCRIGIHLTKNGSFGIACS